jgi:hypothetical protein
MRRTEHLAARALAAVGLVATCAYLVWRVGFSLHDTDLWLSLPVLAVEVVGFLGAAALTWALWPVPATYRAGNDATGAPALLDAVVLVDQQPDHEVRATLLALRAVQHVAQVVLVDLSARPEMAALANHFHAVYAASDPADRNGVRVMLATVRTPQFVLLEAGDVPTGDIVDRLVAGFDDPQVAVVQGLGVSLAEDSAEHGPNGRHELVFERSSLNPALGRRGHAVWLGSGSLVRTDAAREPMVGNDVGLETLWQMSADLMASGWKIVAPGGVAVVAHRGVDAEQAVSQDRVQRARAARRMVFGPRGVLRSGSFSAGQRLSLLAWSVRPLSGLRRVVFLTLLGGALLAGSVPFHASALALVVAWLPAFVYTSLGLALLSGWTLRPGDRARWSLHSMGAACQSLRSTVAAHPVGRAPIVALPAPQYGAGLVIAVVGLSATLVLRGVSDRFTHTLGAMPQSALMALLIVTLWALALSLDLLRVLARRRQLRRSVRVVSSLAATLGERAVSIVDLTPLGAGLISQTGVELSERLLLDSAIPTRTGVTTVRVACIVRNVSPLADGDYRIGVEFGDTSDATADALAEYCTIEPTWARLGTVPSSVTADSTHMVYVDEPESERATGKVAVRLVSLLALVGAVASSVPTTADASPSLEHRLSGVVIAVDGQPARVDTVGDTVRHGATVADTVVTSTEPPTETTPITEPATGAADAPVPVPGAVVVGVCSLEAGADGAWGTSDDIYSAPVAVVTDADGNYQIDLVGAACWASVAPPDSFEDVADDSVMQAMDVSGPSTSNRPIVLQVAAATEGSDLLPGSIGDVVWHDLDGDGVQGDREPGVGGVMLTLLDAKGRNLSSVVSADSGEFQFEDVPAGRYRVRAANLPSGFVFTTAMQGADPAVDSDADPITGRTDVVTLLPGQLARGIDVGIAESAAAVADTQRSSSAEPVERVLPAPETSQIAASGSNRSTLSFVVLALAGLLAASILLGLARPRAARAR